MAIDETRDRIPCVDLLIEDAGDAGCLAHVPTLPGLCFRAKTVAAAEAAASSRIANYIAWLEAEDLTDLTARTAEVVQTGEARSVLVEHRPGAPVWESGNAAVLFSRDLRALEDDIVRAHLRFVRRVLDRMRDAVAAVPPDERARRPAPGRRSIDEMLEHVGNCIWWYCSRIDDELPEPDEPEGQSWFDRIDRLFEAAERYLLAFPLSVRAEIHVPMRFPTNDPNERWTHTKVCRRQAEHVWAHLNGWPGMANVPCKGVVR